RVTHELAPVDQPVHELALQGGNEDVLVRLAHGRTLRRPAGGASVGGRRSVVNRRESCRRVTRAGSTRPPPPVADARASPRTPRDPRGRTVRRGARRA